MTLITLVIPLYLPRLPPQQRRSSALAPQAAALLPNRVSTGARDILVLPSVDLPIPAFSVVSTSLPIYNKNLLGTRYLASVESQYHSTEFSISLFSGSVSIRND